MDYKNELEKLNKASLEQIEAYLKEKGKLKGDEHLKVVKAKDEWQTAYNKFIESLMVLERLEL